MERSQGIAITCAGTWHAPHMAYELQRRGMLRYILTTMPPSRYRRRAPISRAAIRWVPFPELIGPRVLGRWGPTRPAEFRRAVVFDWIASRKLRGSKPDLLIAFTNFGLASLRAMREAGIPTVTECGSCHVRFRTRLRREEREAVGIPVESASIFHSTVARELEEYEAADYISVPSPVAARSFIDEGIPQGKVLQIPYGVDIATFSPGPRPNSPNFRVLTVGQLGIEKGTHHLIEALEKLSDKSIELICVGAIDPWMRRRLEESQGVIWTFLGKLSPVELADEYRRASVMCLPSLHEGMSLAVLEAMASGLPVIVSENTGYTGVVRDGREGFIVPIRSPEEIAARIAQLQDEEDLRHAMGVYARDRAEQYTWASYGDRLELAYRPIIMTRQ